MNAITLKQPWAHLVFNDNKDCENRTWKLPRHCINTWIALHAGKTYDRDCPIYIPKKDLVFGAIVGFVKFSDCVTDHPSEWAIAGQYHWVIAEKKTLELPIPCKGYQGFWRFDQGEVIKHRDHAYLQLSLGFTYEEGRSRLLKRASKALFCCSSVLLEV